MTGRNCEEILLQRKHTAAINDATLSNRHILAGCEDGSVIIVELDSLEVYRGVVIRPETCVAIRPESCVAIRPITRKKIVRE